MDTLAYSSRMLGWAPLGKLFFVIMVLIANLATSSMLVPVVTLAIGLILMAYSTNFRIPFLIALALAEALVIIAFGCGMVSISGDTGTVIWDTHILWVHVHMTDDSFNKAWLILFRGVAGMAVMMAFATSTPIPHLSQALRQAKIPTEISELVVLIYRYGFLLLERMEVMWNAASCRMGFNGAMRSISTVASIAVGIFISSTNLADKAQTALECRNYQGYFPVYNQPPKMGVKWLAISVLTFAGMYVFGMYTEGWIDMCDILLSGVIA
ncbi:MAG: energy-coupling factor transporter transmembrane component T [Thermoplasmata archaeon]|nr:energy-coupling factor transporter transmembrane component T [Thermoplasmata archaeon]